MTRYRKDYGRNRRTGAAEKPSGSIVAARAGFSGNAESAYRRERHLPALIACWPEEIRDASLAGAENIIRKLQRALRAERRRGRAGHWVYDLNRHVSLVAALKAETINLANLKRDLRDQVSRNGSDLAHSRHRAPAAH